MKNRSDYQSIDEYISICPADIRPVLEKLREVIRAAAPEAIEKISYRMPAFEQNGILVYFAAQKNHIGFYPTSEGIENFKDELSVYGLSKGTVRFPADQPIPYDLISRIVKHRVEMNMKKASAEKKGKA